MNFSYKNLTEEDEKFIESFKFHMPIGRRDELAPIPIQWVVDKGRECYLICLAGQGDTFDIGYPPYYYCLILGRSVVKIRARYESQGDFNTGVLLKWRIDSIIVPRALRNIMRDELLIIIQEAFIVFGNIHECGHVVGTVFDRICMPVYEN